ASVLIASSALRSSVAPGSANAASPGCACAFGLPRHTSPGARSPHALAAVAGAATVSAAHCSAFCSPSCACVMVGRGPLAASASANISTIPKIQVVRRILQSPNSLLLSDLSIEVGVFGAE